MSILKYGANVSEALETGNQVAYNHLKPGDIPEDQEGKKPVS